LGATAPHICFASTARATPTLGSGIERSNGHSAKGIT
jgi:hypothetical protein